MSNGYDIYNFRLVCLSLAWFLALPLALVLALRYGLVGKIDAGAGRRLRTLD